ncbi:hypothetical protein EB796_017663 [Bugula neritina]|uniref:Phosphagen kinase C-terminal domain-containing protein n=1 Tax=Bugula neritina TaxID=10212 RepID=A0A7J7JDB3_BUGNE|nr:hypothetical protein EB796_017663 [Bugula neritina]
MCTDCLGNLGPRLDCLGTSLQASVSVKMPKVCGHDKVKEILAGLQLRKEVGKDGGEVISNKCTLGSTEVHVTWPPAGPCHVTTCRSMSHDHLQAYVT